MRWKEKIALTNLELIVLGQSGHLLSYAEGVRVADHVLRMLVHQLQSPDGSLVDLHSTIPHDQPDHLALAVLVATGRVVGRHLEAEAPWCHDLQQARGQLHAHALYIDIYPHLRSSF